MSYCTCSSNASSAVQTQQLEQQASTALVAESLLAQLGHLPSQLNASSSLVSVSGLDHASIPASAVPPHVQLSRQKRNTSTPEQYYQLRAALDPAAAQQLQSSSLLSVQFLEPPNSLAPSGQLRHSALATHASAGRVSADAASEKSALHSVTSMPHNSSLIRPGVPIMRLDGVSCTA